MGEGQPVEVGQYAHIQDQQPLEVVGLLEWDNFAAEGHDQVVEQGADDSFSDVDLKNIKIMLIGIQIRRCPNYTC